MNRDTSPPDPLRGLKYRKIKKVSRKIFYGFSTFLWIIHIISIISILVQSENGTFYYIDLPCGGSPGNCAGNV